MTLPLKRQRRNILEQLFELSGLLGDAMQGELSGHGLTPARAEVVWCLHHRGPMTQRQLSEELRCTPRNVTGLVDVLASAGIAARNPHPSDRRATLVTLTPHGKKMAAAWETGYQALAGHLFSGIGHTDLERLSATLDQIVSRLRDATLVTPA